MRMQTFLMASIVTTVISGLANAQPVCAAPELPSQHIKEIVAKERLSRTDLPEPFPKYKWTVRREGCHYIYREQGEPAKPHYTNTFWLNQVGVIVDASTGGIAAKEMKCPDKVLSEQELAEIVNNARKKRPELPGPYKPQKTRVDRMRCLYVYYEYALPETAGIYHTFTIDPFGELMQFFRGRP
jgi:hypothetical protein